jgi:hypothetical protein
MGTVHLDPEMATWSSRLDLEQLAARVEEIRQRLADRQQLLESLRAERERAADPASAADRAAAMTGLAGDVVQLKDQFEGLADVLEWEQRRRGRERRGAAAG